MEDAVNKLTIEVLSQPLILIFVIIGILGFVYSIIKNVKYYAIHIILFIFVISLVGVFGKEFQTFTSFASIILIVIFCIFFILIKNIEYKKKNIINEKSFYDESKDNICPKCGGVLKECNGKYGKFLGCSNYPNCKFVRKIDENQNVTVNVNIMEDKKVNSINIESNNKCPQCGGDLTLKNGKYGKFYGCSNYPKCKYTKNVYGKHQVE